MLGIKTVEGVLKNFNKTINDLRSIAVASETKSDDFNAKASDFIVKADEADVERSKATNIADKLEKLISGE